MKFSPEFADRYNMLPQGSTVICAVSGGMDSVCLLHAVKELSAERGLRVYAAHFNHCLRGEESKRDERFVKKLCDDLKVELFTSRGDVKKYAEEKKLGIEDAARHMRYAFFEELAAGFRPCRVATAHNANDNAETMLMNLARGAGLRGMCGIPPVRGIYVRPLLAMSRSDIERYLSENMLGHVEDSSNDSDDYTRNRIRHHVIPILMQAGRGFPATATAAASLMREDEQLLEALAAEAVKIRQLSEGSLELSVHELTAAPAPLASRAIIAAAERLGQTVNTRHIQAVLKIACSALPSAEAYLPGGICAARRYDRIVFSLEPRQTRTFAGQTLCCGDWTSIVECGLDVYSGEVNENTPADEIFFFKKSAICGNISVRPRKAGDNICLSRKQGRKSLKKLFIEKKIPAFERELVPVIADEEKVLAVVSLGQEATLAAEKSEAAIMIAVKFNKQK